MRLIDADEVIEKINDMEITPTTNLFELLGRFIGIIDTANTVDTAKQGKWVEMRDGDIDGMHDFCSVCQEEAYFDYDACEYVHFDYCPHCGAKMDGDD